MTCCGKGVPRRYSLRKKKKKSPETGYEAVDQTRPTPPAQVNVLPATVENESSANNKAAEAVRNVEPPVEVQDLTYARLAFQNESRQQQAPPALPSTPPRVKTTYAELSHEPGRSKMPASDDSWTPAASPPGSPIYMQPIYAQVRPKSTTTVSKTDNNPLVDDSIAEFPSPPVSPSATAAAADADDEMNVSPPPAARKSYIPLVYLKESPEVQQKQQALNNELKEAVRVNRVTDF